MYVLIHIFIGPIILETNILQTFIKTAYSQDSKKSYE